ncbi:MAG: branched-chain amino acid ABC transporter permease [Desulfovibrionaceae bacterium]|nr:branched-chain amino acid ABC transporter permease [Desulfovibrionaceae bacterium]
MAKDKSLIDPSYHDDVLAMREERRRSVVRTVLVLAAVISLPLLMSLILREDAKFSLNIIALICLWGAMAGAWNILGGYAGKFSLGNAAFFGAGAYSSSILFVKAGVSPWVGMVVGVGISMCLALFLGIITLRLKGKFFALCTIAFLALMEIAAVHARKLTGGAEGLLIPWRPGVQNMIFENELTWVYIFMGLMLFVYFLSRRLECSPIGYRWTALRENEDAAEALGINTLNAKLSSFVISAALTSVGGTLYAQYNMFIEPMYVFGHELSIQFALYAIIGGMGTAIGPIMGAAVITPLEITLRSSFPDLASGASLTVYALILILVVLFIPRGIVVEFRDRCKKAFAKLGASKSRASKAGGACSCLRQNS